MRLTIGLLMLSIALLFSSESLAQEKTNLGGYLVPMCVYNGDTIGFPDSDHSYIQAFKIQKQKRADGIL